MSVRASFFTLNDFLFAAARDGNLDILRYLLAYLENVDHLPNLIWLDLFHEAIKNDHIAATKLIWEYVDCKFLSSKEQADFPCAAIACDSETHIK